MSDRLRDFYICFRDALPRVSAENNWKKGPDLTKAVKEALNRCRGKICDTIEGWRANNLDRDSCCFRSKEWLLDFCFSSHDLRKVSDQMKHDWKPDEGFHLWLGVESELMFDESPLRFFTTS
jgi:hypothetical protein